MFDYIVRLLVWAVEGGGGAKVSLHPVHLYESKNVPQNAVVYHITRAFSCDGIRIARRFIAKSRTKFF